MPIPMGGQHFVRLDADQRLIGIEQFGDARVDQRAVGQLAQRLHGVDLKRMVRRGGDLHQGVFAVAIPDERRGPGGGELHFLSGARQQRGEKRNRRRADRLPAV